MGLLEEAASAIPAPDARAAQEARKRQDLLTKPRGALGRLEALSVQLAGIAGSPRPRIGPKAVAVMAGDHGVTAEGVSAYPSEVTPQMVLNFLRGGAAINVLARHSGARVVVVDVGVAADLPDHPGLVKRKVRPGTRNFAKGPAMSRDEARRAVEVGIEIAEEEFSKGLSLLGTGDMGIGNTTASAALASLFTGRPVPEVAGRGTGIDDAMLRRKVGVIEGALKLHRPDPGDPLEVLAKVGGLEIGAIAGLILGAARRRVPVLVDGFISGAGALVAAALAPRAKEYMLASHCSAEPGHRVVLDHLGLKPLLDFDMRLGEGTGAALAMFVVEGAAKILDEMATFQDADVSGALKEGIG
ncbi:MAG: nicotinate-nucleotide--dimethylbenzimidazole phosphoribosyltransferase [Halobacteria archaeon]